MRLTSKGRYAVTAMLDIALNQQAGAVSLSDIAARQCISLSYLEQIFTRLRREKLVQSVRGPGGGYLIAVPLETVSVQRIVMAMNEDLDARQCQGKENCQHGQACLSHHLWNDLSDMISQFLSGITLATLLNNHQKTPDQTIEVMVDRIQTNVFKQT